MVLLWLMLMLANQQPSFCSCIPPGSIDDKQYNEYDLIAHGKVMSVEDGKRGKVITFSVSTYFKGGGKERSVTIISPTEEGICGIFPVKGEQWLMFAFANGKSYRTNLCTRTKNMNAKASDYRKEEIAADILFLEAKLKQNSR